MPPKIQKPSPVEPSAASLQPVESDFVRRKQKYTLNFDKQLLIVGYSKTGQQTATVAITRVHTKPTSRLEVKQFRVTRANPLPDCLQILEMFEPAFTTCSQSITAKAPVSDFMIIGFDIADFMKQLCSAIHRESAKLAPPAKSLPPPGLWINTGGLLYDLREVYELETQNAAVFGASLPTTAPWQLFDDALSDMNYATALLVKYNFLGAVVVDESE